MSTMIMQPMFPILLLLLILGFCMMDSVHGFKLPYPHNPHKQCPPPKSMKFPTTIMVTLNISGQVPIMDADVSSRSLSPWKQRPYGDNNIYPPATFEATCLLDACVDSQGNLDLSVISMPIRQEILVLRRESKGCNYIFILEKRIITVGCTCVRPRTVRGDGAPE